METEYISEFIKIAQLRSFSLAAEELLISQSSLSKHIKTLEAELGSPLFDRTTRSVMLTPLGQNILSLCETIEDCRLQIRRLSAQELSKNRNHLLITSIPVMAQYNITGSIANFLKSHPDIHLTFSESESLQISNVLKNGDYELAFTRIIDKEDPDFESIPFYEDQLVVVLPKRHPLANRKSIEIQELKHESFVFLDENTMLYTFLSDLCRKSGFVPHIVQSAHRPENIIDLVSKDFGVSLLYRKQADYVNHPNAVAIDISPLSTSLIALTKLRSHKLSFAATAFWNYIQPKNKPR